MNIIHTRISKTILIILLSIMDPAKSTLRIRLTGLVCTATDKKFFEMAICDMKPINRETFIGSLHMKLLEGPITNLMISTKLFKRGFEHLGPILNINTDACVFLKSNRRNPVASWVYSFTGFECCSNINHSCPINHDVIISNYMWNDTSVQLAMPFPTGSYVLNCNLYISKKDRAKFVLFIHVTDK